MDQQLMMQKLESLRRCLNRVEEKCPADVQTLQQNLDVQDIVVLNLTRAVQLCVDMATHLIADSEATMPATMGESFKTLHELGIIEKQVAESLRKAVGFRNVAVHNYDVVDWDIVYAICTQHMQDFKIFAKQVSNYGDL
jgi:uncharacterized protein YutE (UPF0331/DUF86 family)